MSPQNTNRRASNKILKVGFNTPQANRPVHRRFFLHPMTIMVMLVAGVLITGYTYKAVAESYTVTAAVYTTPLTEGAYITNPTNNEAFTNSSIEVEGTCPPASYTKLYNNNLFVGVAWCLPNSTFQIAADLYYGTNVLQAQDYNVNNLAGPSTPTISVSYETVSSSSGNSTSNSSGSDETSSGSALGGSSTSSNSVAASTPLLLTTDYQFQTVVVSRVFSWSLDLNGGTPPYKVNVNWGDGSSSSYTFKTDPVFTVTHTYTTQGYFAIVVKASDSHGSSRVTQLAALIKKNNGNDVFVPGSTSSGGCSKNGAPTPCASSISSGLKGASTNSVINFFQHIKTWVWITWSTYIIVVLMMISFWLGEREEDYHIFNRRFKSAHQHR